MAGVAHVFAVSGEWLLSITVSHVPHPLLYSNFSPLCFLFLPILLSQRVFLLFAVLNLKMEKMNVISYSSCPPLSHIDVTSIEAKEPHAFSIFRQVNSE